MGLCLYPGTLGGTGFGPSHTGVPPVYAAEASLFPPPLEEVKGVTMNFKGRTFLWVLAAGISVGIMMIIMGCKNHEDNSSEKKGIQSTAEMGEAPNPQIPCQAINTFKEDVIGFIVKKPTGWLLRYTTGVITILKDDKAQEGVMIYPVRPKAGFSLEDFLSSYLNILKKLSNVSSRIDYSDFSVSRDKVLSKVTGIMGGKTILGAAAAFPSGPDYILTLYWAPTDEFSARQGLLKCIADSYQKTPGLALVKLSGTYFETMAPKGWKILEETSNGVNFKNSAGDAGVMCGYLDFGGDTQPMTIPRLFESATKPCSPGQQPCFSRTKSYTRLAAVDAPDFRDNLGRTWKARAEEFEAIMIGAENTKVHGVLTGMVMCGQHITGLYGWIIATSTRISRPETWERNSAATAIVQENLKIIKASELITQRILPRNNPYDSSTIMGHWEYKNRVDSELSRKRQEAIMGYESFHTSTGERIDVPLNSIPGGNNPLYYNPQTGLTWSSTLEPPPQGYYPLKR
jgi:hypothetical protein